MRRTSWLIATHAGRGLLKTMRTGEGQGKGRGQGEVELAVYRSSFSKSKPVLRTLYLEMSVSPFQGWCPVIRSPPAKLQLKKLFPPLNIVMPQQVSRAQSCVGRDSRATAEVLQENEEKLTRAKVLRICTEVVAFEVYKLKKTCCVFFLKDWHHVFTYTVTISNSHINRLSQNLIKGIWLRWEAL